jgi:hypothetical protein
MAHDIAGVRRRRARRGAGSPAALTGLPSAAPTEPVAAPTPPSAPTEPSFVCATCRRDMGVSERSRIARSKCRACV